MIIRHGQSQNARIVIFLMIRNQIGKSASLLIQITMAHEQPFMVYILKIDLTLKKRQNYPSEKRLISGYLRGITTMFQMHWQMHITAAFFFPFQEERKMIGRKGEE